MNVPAEAATEHDPEAEYAVLGAVLIGAALAVKRFEEELDRLKEGR